MKPGRRELRKAAMERMLADGALAAAAKSMAEEAESLGNASKAEEYLKTYGKFSERSRSYLNIFDPQTRFMRGKDSKGRFRTPFNPFASTHRADDYCEGNVFL